MALVRERLQRIPGAELDEPEGTFLVWIDFNGLGLESDELYAFLRSEAHWSVTRGKSFGKAGIGFARVNIGCTREKLRIALDKLESAIAELDS